MPRGLAIADVMEASTTLAAIPRDEARRSSGVEGSPAMLWVGRLNANKDPLTVLAIAPVIVPHVTDSRSARRCFPD